MTQRYIGGLIYNPPGGYSGYFDGSGNYLQAGTSSNLALGSGDFTVEGWHFCTGYNGGGALYSTINTYPSSTGFLFYIYSDGSYTIDVNGTILKTTAVAALNTWVHYAVVRSGSTITIYANGTSVGTVSNSTNFTDQYAVIGRTGAGSASNYYLGYLSNCRTVKGTAVYTSAFTPPNGPLQAITNTQLLTCRYPTFVDGSSNAFTITVNGNTTVSTQNPFPLTTLPNPAQGGAGNGIFSMSQYQSLKQQNLWPAIDPYFDYTTLLLHGNGTNGGQNNTFQDSSSNNFTITRNGNTTQGTFSPFSQTGWSNYFGGVSGNYLSTTSAGSSVNFGTSNFTFECWLNASSTSGNNFILDARTASTQDNLCVLIQNGSWLWQYAGSSIISTSSGMISVGTWNHIAFVRNSSTLYLYVNGALITSAADTTNYASASAAGRPGIAGGGFNTTEIFNGYISNFRLVKGTAVYTAAFTPPTAPLTNITNTSLLTCQSNRFVDNSSNAYTVTPNGTTTSVQAFSPFAPTAAYSASTVGGSGYFDGSGDYLTFPDSASFDYSTGDFTCDMWVYPTTVSGDKVLLQLGSYGSGQTGIVFLLSNGGKVFYGYNGGFGGESSGSVLINTWSYLSFVRSSGTLKMYVNGVEKYSTSFTSSIAPSTDFSIGSNLNPLGSQFSGYLTSVRLSNTARSSSVPTTPITNDGNTQLLLNFTNAAIIDNTAKNVLETVGNAQISTTQSKFGGASLYFDGTGDYLSAADSPNFYFGSGDWTIEAWLYINTAKNYNGYFGKRQTSLFGLTLQIDSGGTLSISASTTGSSWALAGASLGSGYSTGAWMHVAVTRSGTTITGWRNGTSTGTQTLSGSIFPAIGYFATVGSANDSSQEFNGYIDDFRITKGIARYTSNFTPQTSQWQDQ